MELEITITEHPATANHPIRTNEKLVVDGKPVPLLPDHKAVRLDGFIVAYVLPNRRVSYIVPEAKLTKPVVDAIQAKVEAELGEAVDKIDIADVSDNELEDEEEE